MKVMTILGSPKKNGSTSKMLAAMEEELTAQGHDIDRVDIASCNIKGCVGCFSCQKDPNGFGCIHDDDAESVFERMMSCDAMVFGTPLYVWGFPSQLKALMDRCGCVVKGIGTPAQKSLLEGHRMSLLVTCGGPMEDNADIIQTAFDRFCNVLKCESVGKCVIPFCATPDAIDFEVLGKAKGFAREIAG